LLPLLAYSPKNLTEGVKLVEQEKLEWISCTCKQPLRVIYIDDKPFVHPIDLEHLQICPNDDPQVIRDNQRAIEDLENYY
jgi:hypothetical protein